MFFHSSSIVVATLLCFSFVFPAQAEEKTYAERLGWAPGALGRDEFLILGTQGGLRAEDGSPVALGYHVGHWEVGLLMQAAAEQFRRHDAIPFATFVSDPCDGRTQGTPAL